MKPFIDISYRIYYLPYAKGNSYRNGWLDKNFVGEGEARNYLLDLYSQGEIEIGELWKLQGYGMTLIATLPQEEKV